MATETVTQIVRPSPRIEAYTYGLIDEALNLTRELVPGTGPGTGVPAQYTARPLELGEYGVAGFTPDQLQAFDLAQQGLGVYEPYMQQAGQGISQAMGDVSAATGQYTGALSDVASGLGSTVASAQEGLTGASAAAGDVLGRLREGRDRIQQPQRVALALSDRLSREKAAQALAAGNLGQVASLQGIASLSGTGGQFNPYQTFSYMNPYEQAVVQQTMADIQRQADIQRANLDAQAVQRGAFGGSRSGIQQAELDRSTLEAQARAAANLRNQGYSLAQQQAQNAFEASQRRQQNLAQLTGALGSQGAQAGLEAARLGLTAEQFAAANANAIAQTGYNLEQLEAQTGINAAELSGRLAQQAGQLGIQAAQQQAAALAQAGQLAQQGATTLGQLANQQADIGLGIQKAGQADTTFLFNLGQQGQALEQAKLDAARLNVNQAELAPYQNIGFVSDIIRGVPSGSTSITQGATPSASPIQTAIGTGIGALGALAGASRADLF